MRLVIQRNRNLAEAVFRDALIDEGVFADGIFNSENRSWAAKFFGHFKNEGCDDDSDESSSNCTNSRDGVGHHEFFFAGEPDPAEEHEKACDGLLREPL